MKAQSTLGVLFFGFNGFAIAATITKRPTLPSCHPTKTTIVTETLYPVALCRPQFYHLCKPTGTTTITIPPCTTKVTSTTTPTITTPPAPTLTGTSYGELCPHYCLITSTQLPIEPWKCPPLLGGCDAIVFETQTENCKWCPTMSCASLKTVTETFSCPPTFICPETQTEWVPCPYTTKPPGYTFTIG